MSSTMKVAVLAVAALMAGLASAQGSLPSCATDCVTQFTSGSSIGGCSSIDIACICSNKDFLSGIACCLAGKCDQADQEAATSYAQNFCKISGVTNLPTAVSCASTVAPSSTVASSGSSVSSVSSATEAITSSVSSAQSSVSSSASRVSSSLSSVAASVSSQAASSTSSSANAGPQNVAGLGAGVLGGLVAAVALL